jgi:phosphate-selective porin OprO and OprP
VSRMFQSSTLAVALVAGWVSPAQAASAQQPNVAEQMAAMQAQLDKLSARVDSLEGQVVQERARADAAEAKVAAAVTEAQTAREETKKLAAATVTAKPATEVSWDGAPRLATKDGWSFKPRGRLQIDCAGVDAPGSVSGNSLGVGTEFRRAYIGFDGTMPGGFGYRVEGDIANGGFELTDVYMTYKASPKLTLTLGQHKPFQSMEDMTSDLFTSFMERAAFNGGFGFERRVGFSGTYTGKAVVVQAGVFTDNAADLNADTNNSYSLDTRVVFMPKLGEGQLHLGGSFHLRDFNDAATSTRYRARPFVHTTDARLVNTGNITATGETGYGLELAYVNGRFHATAESSWMKAKRPGLADPTFNGGYAELGMMLTGDKTAYRNGVYDRIRPSKPLGKGGLGALQANLRYDWLDLSDGTIIGGRQQIAGASLVWIPTDYVRFLVNYGHLWLSDAAVPAGVDREYQADSIGLRAQIDF